MKVIEIKNLKKKEIPLHYRNEYSASVVFETNKQIKLEKRCEFILERSAIGSIDISVNLLDDLEYPLIPAIRTLKQYILNLDKEGKLS